VIEARAYLDIALAECERMDMQPALERAHRLAERLGTGTQQPAPAYPDGLSEREVEVLRLIAAGRSNREIAEALVISLNTVFRHVTHILTKTGAANRTEAAAYAIRHGLVHRD
jgi:DNA-binding NarL/FixJ family response regulator